MLRRRRFGATILGQRKSAKTGTGDAKVGFETENASGQTIYTGMVYIVASTYRLGQVRHTDAPEVGDAYRSVVVDMHMNPLWDREHIYGVSPPSEHQLQKRRAFLKTRGEKHTDPAPDILQGLFSKSAYIMHSLYPSAHSSALLAIPPPWRGEQPRVPPFELT